MSRKSVIKGVVNIATENKISTDRKNSSFCVEIKIYLPSTLDFDNSDFFISK